MLMGLGPQEKARYRLIPPILTCTVCKLRSNGQSYSASLPPGEYRWGVGWTCHSDSVLIAKSLWPLFCM